MWGCELSLKVDKIFVYEWTDTYANGHVCKYILSISVEGVDFNVHIYIYIYIYISVDIWFAVDTYMNVSMYEVAKSTLVKELTAATCVMQSFSTEWSTPLSGNAKCKQTEANT